MKKDKTIQGIRRRELTVRKQILKKEIEELEEFLNQSAPDEDTKYFERVIKEKKDKLAKMTKGWLSYLDNLTKEYKVNITEVKILDREEKQMKEPRVLSIEQATDLDEIQNYLRDHNGLLFDDEGDRIIDVEFDRSDGEIVGVLEDGYKRGNQDLAELHNRMRLVKSLVNRKREVDGINWKIKEMLNWYNSDDFQYSGDGENGRSEYTKKGANEIADEKEKIAKDRIDAELFLCEIEIKRVTKIKMIIENYRNKFEEGRQYFMDLYNEKGQKVERHEL